MKLTVLGLAAAAAVMLSSAARAEPTAKLDAGVVQGAAAGDLLVFKGIPYAAGTGGALRWRAPQPVAAWTGLRPRDSLRRSLPPAAPQRRRLGPGRAAERGLPVPQRLAPGQGRKGRRRGHGVHPWRLVHPRLGRGAALRRLRTRQAWRGGGDDQLPPGPPGLFRPPGADRRERRRRLARQLRHDGPDRRPEMGADQHPRVRRRPEEGHGVRRVRRRRGGADAGGLAPPPRTSSCAPSPSPAAARRRPRRSAAGR